MQRSRNKYDYLIILILGSISSGVLFTPFTLPRLISIALSPYLISNYRLIVKYIPIYVSFFFLTWLLGAILSIAYSYSLIDSIKFFFYNTCSIAIFLEIVIFSLKACKPRQSIITGCIIMILMTSIVAYWELITDRHLSCNYTEDLYLGSDITIKRLYASVTFGNLNYYVVNLCFILPLLFYGLTLKGINKYITTLCITSAIILILMNASRGGLICVMLMLMVALYYLRRSKIVGKFGIILIIIVFLSIITFFSDVILAQLMSKLISNDGITTDDSRMSIIMNCLKVLSITNGMGSGMGSLEIALEKVSPSDIPAPHNLLLEFAAQYGIIVFIPFLIFLITLLVRLYKSNQWESKMLGLIYIVIFVPLSIINSVYLASTDVWTYLSCMLCIVLLDKYGKTNCSKYSLISYS